MESHFKPGRPVTARWPGRLLFGSSRLLAGLIAFCLFVFLLDLAFPVGAGSAVPYVLAAIAALWLPGRKQRHLIGVLSTGLAALGFFFPLPEAEFFWIALQNRFVSVLAIWTTLYLGNLLIRRTDELRDRESRLRAILDAAVDAVLTTDRDGRIESCNPAAEWMFGYPADRLVGQNIGLIVSGLEIGRYAVAGAEVPESDGVAGVDVRGSDRVAAAEVRGGVAGAEVRGSPSGHSGADARRSPSGRGHALAPPALPQSAGVLQARRRDGSTFPVNVALSEVLAGELQPSTAVVAIVRDISELVAAQVRAIQSERLAAIGQTITALSHESRNELNTLHLTAELLSRVVKDSPEVLDLVRRLRESQNRLIRLFEDVRGYAAPVVLELGECCLADVWTRAWQAFSAPRAARDAILREQADAVDLTCLADAFRLEQVFRNLFENSLSACADPVRIEVRCAPAELHGEPALAVTIRDNGPGIPPEIRDRVFEPFFTTNSRGTGLGMPICRRIIEAHGGTLEVGEARSGAEIQIVLPRQPPGASPEPAGSTVAETRRHRVAEPVAR